MKLEWFIKGVQILTKYYNIENQFVLGAEHDKIFFYPTDREVSNEDFNTLQDIGWMQDGSEFDFILNQFIYDQELSWVAYV